MTAAMEQAGNWVWFFGCLFLGFVFFFSVENVNFSPKTDIFSVYIFLSDGIFNP